MLGPIDWVQCCPYVHVGRVLVISADASVNIQEVVAQYLPAAPPLQPATAVDTRAIPHSLHLLNADSLTDQALDDIE